MSGPSVSTGSAPCFPFGLYDDIPALGRLALEHDLWLHCDACVGGFLAPFFTRLGEAVPPWDFSVPGVMSVSADIHKFGYGLKPASVTRGVTRRCWSITPASP